MHTYMHTEIHLYIYSSIHLSIYLSISLYRYRHIHICVYAYVCMGVTRTQAYYEAAPRQTAALAARATAPGLTETKKKKGAPTTIKYGLYIYIYKYIYIY